MLSFLSCVGAQEGSGRHECGQWPHPLAPCLIPSLEGMGALTAAPPALPCDSLCYVPLSLEDLECFPFPVLNPD